MRAAIAVLAFWVHASPALAGVPIDLPDGEDIGPWLIPLQLAGLDLTDGPAPLRITSTEGAPLWTLWAKDEQGRQRTVEVPRPRTARDREELAFLARGLVRDLGEAPTPAARRSPRLPAPPPPPPLPAAPPEVVATPTPPRDEGTDDEVAVPPPPEPVLPPQSELMDAFTDPLRPVAPPPARGQARRVSPDDRRKRRRRKRAPTPFEVPPLAVGMHTSFRPLVQPGFTMLFGIRAPQAGPAYAEMRIRITANRGLAQLDLLRQLAFVDFDVTVGTSLFRSGSVGVGASLSYRQFRQQFITVGTSLAPVIHTSTELPLITTRRPRRARPGRWSLNLELQTRLDLQATEMILEDQSSQQLLPVEIGTGLTLRFFGAGDLFVRPPTSTGR